MVLNAKNFPGSIQIAGSSFQKNMAYIKDYYIEENKLGAAFIEPGAIKYSDFERQKGQLNFKVCDLLVYKGVYLSQFLTNPQKGFDDVSFVANYEQVSPLLIVENQGPVILLNNLFAENIGTTGGAIHIKSPDFESKIASN